jgi:putative transposase
MTDGLHYSLNSNDVHELTVHLLSELPLEARGDKVEVEDLLNVVVFAASMRISVNQACQTLEESPSGATVLGELARQLHDVDKLENDLNERLARLLPKGLGRKGRRVAIDLVRIPYHGSVGAEHEGEVCRSKATSGTTHFFTYATAYVILHGRRYTLALTRVRKGDKMVRVLMTLMGRLQALGVQVSLLLVDRGFYSVGVIDYLSERQQSFIMPAIKRGKKPDSPGGPTGTQALAQAKSSYWTDYTLSSPIEGKVSFELAVVCRNLNGKWEKHEREALLYATWGVRARSLGWIKQTYRSRFGIESSYRQLNQAKIRTSTRNPVLRLLFVGVALILRNVWVWPHAEVIALPRKGARVFRPACLRFGQLLIWLVVSIVDHYRLLREFLVPRDWRQVRKEFGLIFNY